MAVITLNGEIGSGALDIGPKVAQRVGADYIDRLVLAEASKRLGATIEALVEKEQQAARLGGRIAGMLQRLLERSAVAGIGADPYFGSGIDALLARPYDEAGQQPITQAQQLDDTRFLEVTSGVIRNLAEGGNVVILGRASNIILKDMPGVLHVGLVAPLKRRIEVTKARLQMEDDEAERYTAEQEKGRQAYFRKFFKADANDPQLYSIVLNTGYLPPEAVVEIIVNAVEAA